MGIYLYASSSSDEVKVSGLLSRVVPVASSPMGSMPASEFLERLTEVETEFRSSPEWDSLVSSGAKEQLDASAQSGGVACAGSDGPVAVWFADRRLVAARHLGEAALIGNSPVCWS